eukprot:scaffold647_cov150-Skeletonema_menzelii.AAC.12
MKLLFFTVKSCLIILQTAKIAAASTYATTAGDKAQVNVSCPNDNGSAQCCSTSSWQKIETNSTATAFGSGDCVVPVSEGIYYGCLSSPGCTLDCPIECSVELGVMDTPLIITTTTVATTAAAVIDTEATTDTNTDAAAPNNETMTTVVATTTMGTMPAGESIPPAPPALPIDDNISDNSKSVMGASTSFAIAIVAGASTLVAMLITS